MGLFDRFRETDNSAEVNSLKSQLETATFRLEEATHTMEKFYAEDRGWEALNQQVQQEMSPAGRRRAAELCRVMKIANPLVKRGLAVRAGYVHGEGLGVQAPDERVNEVIQAFLDDQGNRRAFTGAQRRMELEGDLGTDGNIYVIVFTNRQTGFVRVRTIDSLEITDQYTNPEDSSETWYYRRDFVEVFAGERTGTMQSRQRTVWYPALHHQPIRREATLDGKPVDWNAAIYHIRVNTVGKWGLGDAYAAIPWARAHKEFLEDWVKMMKALSRITWQVSSKDNQSQKIRSAFQGLQEAGGAVHMDSNSTLEAVPKTGATIDANSSKPLAMMVAAAFGIPVTMLLSDPGQTGARAVAETLDRPTENEMNARREIWTEAMRAILNYVIDQAVLAPMGPLKGGLTVDSYTQQEEVELTGDRTLTITWPDLTDTPIDLMVKAVGDADATGKMPPLETMRLLLRALGVRDVDEIIEEFTDEEGNFIDPNTNAGDVAVGAYLAGTNPADALRGDEEDADQ